MLVNLFDAHPQLSVYPVDVNLLYAYFPSYNDPGTSEADLLVRIRRVVFADHAPLPQLASIDFKKLESNFMRHVRGEPLHDMRVVLPALLKAYSELYPTAQEKKYFVAKETCIEIYAQEIANWFPNCRFIHLIRDPRDNYAAIKSGITKKYAGYGDTEASLLFSTITRNIWGIRFAEINRRILGDDRYRAIRFEDLVENPEHVMREIAEWLEIDFEDSLLSPTICGRPTGGNSFENKTFSGISSAHVGKWRERITPEEAAVIEFSFDKEMRDFGYIPESTDHLTASSMAKFYKFINHKYFYFDRFSA
jgi:hypothetical protein